MCGPSKCLYAEKHALFPMHIGPEHCRITWLDDVYLFVVNTFYEAKTL